MDSDLTKELTEFFESKVKMDEEILDYLRKDMSGVMIKETIKIFENKLDLDKEILETLKFDLVKKMIIQSDDRGRITLRRIYPALFESFPDRKIPILSTQKFLLIPLDITEGEEL